MNRRTLPVVEALRGVMADFNGRAADGKRVSLADLIVLGGCAAVEQAAADAGVPSTVPFTPGRMDTTPERTDEDSFEWLKPVVDGFRNYQDPDFNAITAGRVAPETMFLDKADLLGLTAAEWVALTGGLRVLGANWDGSAHGVFTTRVGALTTDFFTAVTSMDYAWAKDGAAGTYVLNDRDTGERRFTATRNDLIMGANSQLRAAAEVYAADDGQQRFVAHFIAVWDKVMMADRF